VRIIKHPVRAGTALWLALNPATSADIAVDQIAHGEAHIGLEGVYAKLVQTIPKRRRILRECYVNSMHTLSVERDPLRRSQACTGFSCASFIPTAYIEMGCFTAIANQKGRAIGEATEQVDHGGTTLITIGGL